MAKFAWHRHRGPVIFLVPILTYTVALAAWYATKWNGSDEPGSLGQRAAALGLAIVTFWWTSGLHATEEGSRTVLFVEHALFVLGVSFVVQSLVNYVFATPVLPVPALILGTVLGSALVALEYGSGLAAARQRSRALLIAPPGADANEYAFASVQPLWADPARNADVIGAAAVDRIVVREKDWSRIPTDALIRRMSEGVVVADAKTEYERRRRRVSLDMLSPADLVFDPAFRSGRHIMAVQAIYTDLVGLLFLIPLLPLMMLCGIAVALSGGPGPIVERVQCTGFQCVPFALKRFRTRNSRTGELTRIGAFLRRTHLASLPQLFNIIRGEMVFFGPRPIREEFAAVLMDLIPFYSHVFTVKPGVLGWSQANTPADTVLEEFCRLEHAFYYIKYGSLALDIEILSRTFRSAPKKAPAAVGTASA